MYFIQPFNLYRFYHKDFKQISSKRAKLLYIELIMLYSMYYASIFSIYLFFEQSSLCFIKS
jgi:hypothetical protein